MQFCEKTTAQSDLPIHLNYSYILLILYYYNLHYLIKYEAHNFFFNPPNTYLVHRLIFFYSVVFLFLLQILFRQSIPETRWLVKWMSVLLSFCSPSSPLLIYERLQERDRAVYHLSSEMESRHLPRGMLLGLFPKLTKSAPHSTIINNDIVVNKTECIWIIIIMTVIITNGSKLTSPRNTKFGRMFPNLTHYSGARTHTQTRP